MATVVRCVRGVKAREQERERGGTHGVEAKMVRMASRWLGRLVGAAPPVNSPLSHCFFLISFSKSLNAIFEALATFFRS